MSDPRIPDLYKRTTPSFQQRQRQSFWELNDGKFPLFNTEPDKLEEQARTALSQNGRLYAESNAGNSWTHLANRQAFYRHRIIPHQLVDTNERDMSTTLFGHKVAAPIGFAPIGINKIYNAAGEIPVAKVAGKLMLPYGLSTAGSSSIEDVAEANDTGRTQPDAVNVEGSDNNPVRFFQLYMPHDDELTVSLLTRAHQNGFTACILTTDTWQLGWRHDDIATSNYAFYRGIGADLGLTDPVYQKRMKEAGIDPKKQPEIAAQKWIDENVWHGRAFSWEKIPWLIKTWKEISGGAPFMIKGIQSVADALLCVDVGCDGIVVSNHAGRQVDGAIASLDALDNIIKAGIGEKIVVTFDSGVRGASDIIKALCLGAKFIWFGRLWIWGLSIAGEAGVDHVTRSLLAEFDIAMAVGGFRSMSDFTRERLESYEKSYSLIAEKSKL